MICHPVYPRSTSRLIDLSLPLENMAAESFFAKLSARARQVDSLLCIGLDPHISHLPEPTAAAAEKFCIDIIAATSEYAAAYKPNAAFFEVFGGPGVEALKRVIEAIPDGIPVLLDAKRGDISTTASAYAQSAFEHLKAGAITLSPYMGSDSIRPFLDAYPGKGAFVLCKTSNPSAGEVQALQVESNGKSLAVFEHVAMQADAINEGRDNIGVVVGATDVDALRRVRRISSRLWILAPGVGAQGADVASAVAAGINSEGLGLLVPVSRALYCGNPGETAKTIRDEMNEARKTAKNIQSQAKVHSHEVELYQEEFVKFAIDSGVLKFGDFTLKSGRKSPYFFNAGLFNTGARLRKLGQYYAKAILKSAIEFDVIFGPAYKGIPLAATIAIALSEMTGKDIPYAFNRKEAKDHGEGGTLVGAEVKNERVLIVDDVITAGTAIRETMALMKKAHGNVVGVVVALDRMEKGSGDLSAIQEVEEQFKIPVVHIISLEDLWVVLEKNATSEEDATTIKRIKTIDTRIARCI